jgi:hypothetical protein
MSVLRISIDLGNAAFDDSLADVSRILRETAGNIADENWSRDTRGRSIHLFDSNGNRVGEAVIRGR